MSDLSEPSAIGEAFCAAWNAHDMAALGALFHSEATFVNRFGTYCRGRDAIVAQHQMIHASIYSDSALSLRQLDSDAVTGDVAVVHARTRLDVGAAHPAGAHTIDTLLLFVMSRHADAWRVRAAENVLIVDPRTGAPILQD